MLRFSANLNMMFREFAFIDRFSAAAKAGFKAVEFAFPYGRFAEKLKKELAANHLELVHIYLPAGNWPAGDRGMAVDPARTEEFKKGVEQAIAYAAILGAKKINCLVGKAVDAPRIAQHYSMIKNLQYAADRLAESGSSLLVDHVDARDMPSYFLNTAYQVLQIIKEVNRPNVYLQYNLYHAEQLDSELYHILRDHLPRIGHIQIADNPGWHEPGTGKIDYRAALEALDRYGYNFYVGLDYVPSADTWSSLEWVRSYGYAL
ncbi:MAG: hydroxypyruvate isomerase [Firmicutes bacterium]|nr:hydroxypyruvate isomerase [Bacillota bacterium]